MPRSTTRSTARVDRAVVVSLSPKLSICSRQLGAKAMSEVSDRVHTLGFASFQRGSLNGQSLILSEGCALSPGSLRCSISTIVHHWAHLAAQGEVERREEFILGWSRPFLPSQRHVHPASLAQQIRLFNSRCQENHPVIVDLRHRITDECASAPRAV